jgi:hypothetical protein
VRGGDQDRLAGAGGARGGREEGQEGQPAQAQAEDLARRLRGAGAGAGGDSGGADAGGAAGAGGPGAEDLARRLQALQDQVPAPYAAPCGRSPWRRGHGDGRRPGSRGPRPQLFEFVARD